MPSPLSTPLLVGNVGDGMGLPGSHSSPGIQVAGAASNECESWRMFTERLRDRLCASYVDDVLMEYFLCRGLRDVAEVFSEEAGVPLSAPVHVLDLVVTVRKGILSGDVEEVVQQLLHDATDTQEASSTVGLFHQFAREVQFGLYIQALVERIRKQDINGAMSFAASHLVPFLLLQEDTTYTQTYEDALSLLLHEDPVQDPRCLARGLMHPERRVDVANRTVSAILHLYGLPEVPRLVLLLQCMRNAQHACMAAPHASSTQKKEGMDPSEHTPAPFPPPSSGFYGAERAHASSGTAGVAHASLLAVRRRVPFSFPQRTLELDNEPVTREGAIYPTLDLVRGVYVLPTADA